MKQDLEDLTAKCIRCGFCLESCPTYTETGDERQSPRGRIYLVRSAERGTVDWDSIRYSVETCLGCRACETACPSAVEYGRIFELARNNLKPTFKAKAAVRIATEPALLRFASKVPNWISDRLAKTNAPKPQPNLFLPIKQGGGQKVKILGGCAMPILFPGVNQATENLLRRLGFHTEFEAGCCGALHAHNGQLETGIRLRQKLADPLVTNSAGCGSWLKEGDVQALDLSEFLIANGALDLLEKSRFPHKIAYHDACHLAHGQGIRAQPRQLLKAIPDIQIVDLAESDTCCGSAGVYSVTQPQMAKALLARKWANIEASGAEAVVLGNPGCHAWIAQAATQSGGRIRVLHLAEVLELALSESS